MSGNAGDRVSDRLGIRDGRLIVRTGKVEIGQRVSTALVEIAHEELTLARERIEIAPVVTGLSPDEGITSGSNSVRQAGHALRLAAATLRRRACRRAAERMGGEADDWRLEDGALSGPGANRPIPLLEFLRQDDFEIPVDSRAPLLPPRARPAAPPMRGVADMVSGRHRYLHDIDLPGMLHARVVRPPHAHARLAEAPSDCIRALEASGVRVVRDGSFLAVAGPDPWPTIQAAARLGRACRWTAERYLEEGDVFAFLARENALRMPVVDGSPERAPVPPMPPAPDYAVRYERPFTLHGSLGPSAALALWDGETMAVTTHSQGIYVLRESLADSLGLEPRRVILTYAPGAGCYGHNGSDDAALEAALVALSLPRRPILLAWSREDEHCWEPFGPPQAVELAAWTDGSGRIRRLSAESIGGTFRGRPRAGPNRAGPARLLPNRLRANPVPPPEILPNTNAEGGLHRNLTPAYAIPETRLVKNLVTNMPHRTSALRCLGAAANVFALESLMDEVAAGERQDPLSFRLAHLEDSRGRAVLERLAEAIRRRPPAGPTGGSGMAYAQYKNAMARVAVWVRLTVAEDAQVRLEEAILVADAGRVVDLGGLEAQLEGGFLQGASWALHERVAWDRDGIASRDWDSYPTLRFDEVPEIETIALDDPHAESLGAGEASPGPAVAAIANAICDATGLRLRRMPFTPDAIRQAALEDDDSGSPSPG